MSHTVITKLTEKQQSTFTNYVNKWVDIGLDTKECNVIEAVKYIKEAYKVKDLETPKFFIGPVNNPYEGALAEKILHEFVDNKTEFENARHLNELVMQEVSLRCEKKEKISISNQVYGCSDYWLSFYDFFQTETPEVTGLDQIDPLKNLASHIGWWTPLKDVVIMQHKPLEIHLDENNRLHNTDGCAVKYRGKSDVCNLYRINGVIVTDKIINREFNAADIENEENVEVRRVMIDLYGQEKFLQETNAEVVHEDDFGVLYKKELKNDQPIFVVKVVNSTPEPDGSYKDYHIRVDPDCYGGLKTARAAIASTWRNEDGSLVFESPEDYDCGIET